MPPSASVAAAGHPHPDLVAAIPRLRRYAPWQVPVQGSRQERIELLQLVEHMGKLPAEQREVLLLAAVDELREEIAAALAIPVGTVMSRLSRARDKLRRMVAEPPVPLKVVR